MKREPKFEITEEKSIKPNKSEEREVAKMTREEIQAIYDNGSEAVIELVESLLRQIEEQNQKIEELTGRITALENQRVKDSHNSSKPPSSDGFRNKKRSLRQTSGKKPGGQKGHPGATLEIVDKADRTIPHNVNQCQYCGESLEKVEASLEKRQVFDLPELKLEVVEHQAQIKQSPKCKKINKGEFPKKVSNSVQYGEGVKSLARVY